MTEPRTVTYEGVVLRVHYCDKGGGLPRHAHSFSHLVMCHAGKCVVRKEKGKRVIDKYSVPLNLLPQEWHEIEALEDGTVFVSVFKDNLGH